MAQFADVLVPANEEGTRATVLRWCKQVGDTVVQDEPLVELETDKVTVEIAAPSSGTLIEVLKHVNAEVMPDEVLARLSLGGEAAPQESAPPGVVPPAGVAPAGGAPSAAGAAPSVSIGSRMPREASATGEARKLLSPSVRRLLTEHCIAAADIVGTGRDGRVTAQDVTRHAAGVASAGAAQSAHAASAGAASTDAAQSAHAAAERVQAAPPARPPVRSAGSTRVPHTAIRRRVAEHMARSLIESPHVTTLFEADLTRVLAHRSRHAADYESRGARLTLTVYFVYACMRALRAHGEINATFHSDALELHSDVNIGVGTALGNEGLIVPVIHRAQELNLLGTAQRLGQLVEAARAGKLSPADVRGGTFTISNHGVGGSLLAAPIVINQPQVAILGVGKVQRRVCAIEVDGVEAISVRSMCYLTLTIDHRALDAFQANAFLSSVVATLEQWPADER
jgi:2-oxoglutarate dehydrogenase E2 component (dihydrolipoamide succinyltransferase)